MIVGISGPSCSGKTSLARAIAALLGAPTLHLDMHFIADADRPLVNGHPSFERPHQYDGAALLAEMLDAAQRHQHVVAEGFLLFLYPGILDACDHRLHLDVPHRTLVGRRARRASAMGDVKGGRIKQADIAWQAHGEEEWEAHGAHQVAMPGVKVLRPATMMERGSAQEIAQDLVRAWGFRIG